MTPDEMRNIAQRSNVPDHWKLAAEICERLDAIPVALTVKRQPVSERDGRLLDRINSLENAWLVQLESVEDQAAEIEKLRAALRSGREQIESGPDVSWAHVAYTIAKALGETP